MSIQGINVLNFGTVLGQNEMKKKMTGSSEGCQKRAGIIMQITATLELIIQSM